MSDGLFIAAAGATARQHQLDALSDNLANVSTDGYRQTRVRFSNMLKEAGAVANTHNYVTASAETNADQAGSIRQTGRPLDVAIEGEGWFAVQGEDQQTLYTRLGRFTVDDGGQLVTADGRPALGAGGPISGLTDAARIAKDGRVYSGNEVVGQLQLVSFEDDKALVRQGALTFAAREGFEPQTVDTHLVPRSLEGSNVNAVAAMTELVRVQRAFESANKAIDTYRQMDRNLATNVAGR